MIDWFLQLGNIDHIFWYALLWTIACPLLVALFVSIGRSIYRKMCTFAIIYTGDAFAIGAIGGAVLALLFDLVWGIIALLGWMGWCGEGNTSTQQASKQEERPQMVERSAKPAANKKQDKAPQRKPAARKPMSPRWETLPVEDLW